jgi:hypothetical protein
MRATTDEGGATKTDESGTGKVWLTLGEGGSGVEERAETARWDEQSAGRPVAAANT